MTQITVRARRLLGELAYAQRRSFELRTGVSLSELPPHSRRDRREISALDAVWELAPHPGRYRPVRSRCLQPGQQQGRR